MEPKPKCAAFLRPALRIILTAALGQGIAALLSLLLLKRLDAVLLLIGRAAAPGEPIVETLARVFSSLRHAAVVPRSFPAVLLCLTAAALLYARNTPPANPGIGLRKRLLRILSVILAVILFLAAFLLTLWRTDVNGIRFGDVVLSLIRTVRSGALDALSAPPQLPEVIAL